MESLEHNFVILQWEVRPLSAKNSEHAFTFNAQSNSNAPQAVRQTVAAWIEESGRDLQMSYVLSIFLMTFFLEDLALASSLVLTAQNKITVSAAFWACAIGISLGDIALYGIGYGVAHFRLERRFAIVQKFRANLTHIQSSQLMTYSIFVSRFVPGTRLPTYLSAGFARYSLWRFIFLTIISVFPWVALAFLGGRWLQYLLRDHWVIVLLLFVVFLHVMKNLVPKLLDHWDRKALWHSWRRWLDFEFWPGWIFYLPIVPLYILLSLRYRSFLTPFYASPDMKNGGLIGESKWDFLRHLELDSPYTLKAVKISRATAQTDLLETLKRENLSLPLILKPDVGQRGYGVRIQRSEADLSDYLAQSDFDIIAQRLSLLPREAGIFYVRMPNEFVGSIFSITDKHFPVVVGDGRTPLGDLILRDRRARIIAPVYFSRLRKELDSVPAPGEAVPISECGNHCQGAIFINGKDLLTPALTAAIDAIAKKVPGFYFGRIDIRYQDQEALMAGQHFEIVEINGSGSEATHIWDAQTTLVDAYRTLIRQWNFLFAIGYQVRQRMGNSPNARAWPFLKESARVIFSKRPLSVSS